MAARGLLEVGSTLPPLRHEVTVTSVVLGALASRDWRPMHHDPGFARERNGVPDIFLNTPHQALWIERYLTDWFGPLARIGRLRFRMSRPVFPGEEMTIGATVTGVDTGQAGVAWVEVEIEVRAAGELSTAGTARIAIPAAEGDNPWSLTGDDWKP
ncbi:MAG: hypothetical protein J7518_12530 [Nocardioidaceae bacterium]|nr:hypothetical protein [Nocardioidaceae bacterium]